MPKQSTKSFLAADKRLVCVCTHLRGAVVFSVEYTNSVNRLWALQAVATTRATYYYTAGHAGRASGATTVLLDEDELLLQIL